MASTSQHMIRRIVARINLVLHPFTRKSRSVLGLRSRQEIQQATWQCQATWPTPAVPLQRPTTWRLGPPAALGGIDGRAAPPLHLGAPSGAPPSLSTSVSPARSPPCRDSLRLDNMTHHWSVFSPRADYGAAPRSLAFLERKSRACEHR